MTTLTKTQLLALVQASLARGPSVPCRVWPEYRDYERLVRLGLMRLLEERREYSLFRITDAGRARVRLALKGVE